MLRIIVHDFDRDDLRVRCQRLSHALPDVDIRGFATRCGLLKYIASLPPGQPAKTPVCLVDQYHHDRHFRGAQLIATVTRHPDLKDRVALVAFTSFNHPQRCEELELAGARAVVSPHQIDHEDFRAWLDRTATGESRVIPLGDVPGAEEDVMFLSDMENLFPYLRELEDGAKELDEAVRILTVGRMFKDGYTQTQIVASAAAAGIKDPRDIALIRRHLSLEKAYEIGAIKESAGTIDLGAVADAVARFPDRSAARIEALRVDCRRLDGRATIKALADLKPSAEDRQQDGAFIPPDDVPLLNEFLELHDAFCPDRNPSAEDVEKASNQALQMMADERNIALEKAFDRVLHAMQCLEHWAMDPRTISMLDPAQGYNFTAHRVD